ncbi:MAG: hypothetical protein O3A21_09480, partial [Proteobacteria bacterium]|nr:hypothetical protein [Pseudomonadota bacterium]
MLGSITDIVFAPQLPWWSIAALALASASLIAYSVWRGAAGAWWRALACGVLLFALTEPRLVSEERQELSDVAAIVVDESQSQDIGDRRQVTERALAALAQRLERERNLDVRIIRAGKNPLLEDSRREGTLLFNTLIDGISDTPRDRLAGVIMLTDGQVHDVPTDPATVIGAPVHVLLSGGKGERDRRLVIEQAPSYGIVGKELEIKVRVEDEDGQAGRPVQLTVTKDAGETEQHTVTIGRQQTIPFALDHGGQTVLEIAIAADSEELTPENNRALVAVNGVRDRLRVLLVSGEPHPGERTWRNLLKADPSVDLVHFTILRPPEKQDGTPVRELSLIAFPVRELFEIKLKEFDLIIFDRYRRRGVLPQIYLANIVDYVRDGGAVLEAAGPAFATALGLYRTPLGLVLPGEPTGVVHEAGFKPKLSTIGNRHPVTAALPGSAGDEPSWGRWFRMVEVAADQGNTLMDGINGKPVLIVNRIGKGRVAQLLSDHAWLWSRGFETGGPQAELLRRLAHWLMKEPDLEEEQLRASAVGDQLAISRRSLSTRGRSVTVRTPSGAERTAVLPASESGLSEVRIGVEEIGLYRLNDGSKTTVAAVGPLNPVEFSDVRTTERRLAPVAQATGGSVTWLSRRAAPEIRRIRPGQNTSGPGWIGLLRNDRYIVTGVAQFSLMPPWLALVLIVGFIA